MQLTSAQKTTLKAHLAANTNTVVDVRNSQPIAINLITPGSAADAGDNMQHVADWYNAIALSGDSQPLASPLLVWRPSVTIDQINSATDWTLEVAGADDTAKIKNWLKWQSMIWADKLDLTDTQVRQGIATIWGSGGTVDNAIKAKGCGRQDGSRLEVLLSPAGVGGGRVCPVFGQRISGPEITDAYLNG